MKNINITVDSNNSKVYLEDDILGVDRENLQGKIIFSFINDFVDGIAWLEIMKGNNKSYILMEKIDETYQVDILSSLLTEEKIFMNLRVTQDENANGIPVFKSNMFFLKVNDSINAAEEEPEEYPTWLDEANQIISQANTLDLDIATDENGTKIIITKKDGTKEETYVSGSGVTNYEDLQNKPSINGEELFGNKTLEDLGIDQDFVKDNNYVHTDNNFTDTEKTKLANLQNYDDTIINQKLQNKVDKVDGKGLSENDFTNQDKQKLNNLENYDDTKVKQDILDLKNNKANKNEIPDVSDFITKDVNNLTNYYNKIYIDETIGNIETLLSEV